MAADKQAKIQFYDGVDEPVVPEIRLTRGNDGTTGQAIFILKNLKHYLQLPMVRLQE